MVDKVIQTRFSQIEFEQAMGEQIQILQFQCIDSLHMDNEGRFIMNVKLDVINMNFPIFKFMTQVDIEQGRVEILDSNIFYLDSEVMHPLYMYMDTSENSKLIEDMKDKLDEQGNPIEGTGIKVEKIVFRLL